MRKRLCILLVVGVLAQTTFAAERVEVGTVLSIDLGKGTITDVKRKEETSLLTVNTFEVRRNETVKFEVLQNLLLFTYTATSVKTNTPDYDAALEFAKQLQALLALFPASHGSGVGKRTLGGLDSDQFQKDLAKVLEFYDRLGSDLGKSIGTADQVAQLKKDYNDADFEAIAKRLDDAYLALTRISVTCGDSNAVLTTNTGERVLCDGSSDLDLNAGMAADRLEVRSLEAKLPLLEEEERAKEKALAAAQAELDSATKAKKPAATIESAKVAIAKLQDDLTGIKFMWDRLNTERLEVVNRVRASEANIVNKATLASFARDMNATQGKISELVTLLVSFGGDVATIGRPFPLATVAYSLQKDTETIEVKAASKYDKFLTSETRKKRDSMLKKFDIVVTPHQPAHLSIAPAFVLGFVKNPQFSAVKDGDTFKIVKKEDVLTRYTLGIMMNITPDAWQEPTFGGHFQIGITPVKDQLGFYLGAGIKAQKLLSFGAGFMYQQVKKLGGDLTIDTRLDDPAKLKTESEFKPGAYLHITVEIPK